MVEGRYGGEKILSDQDAAKSLPVYIKVQALDMFHTSAPASVPSHLFKQEPCVRHEVFEKVGSDSRF